MLIWQRLRVDNMLRDDSDHEQCTSESEGNE